MNDVTILNMARKLAEYSALRQEMVAANVANADTPGWRARDLIPFAETYERLPSPSDSGFFPAATRPGHMTGPVARPPAFDIRAATVFGAPSPNGNAVSLEDQMVRAAEVRSSHDMALGVWRKSMDVLRASLGAGR